MKARIIETNELVNVYEYSPGIYRIVGGFGPSQEEYTYDELDFNPYKDKRVEILDRIINELKTIRTKFINNEEVGNDDWVKPAAILHEYMPLFMADNPDADKLI